MDWEAAEKLREKIEGWFDEHRDEFLKFDLVESKRSRRPDLHAFLLLDSLRTDDRRMVAGAEHDEIFLDVPLEEIASLLTPEIVRDLNRCGVRLSREGLCMFV